jgi:hypothetical protein
VATETVESAILLVVGNDTFALAVFHDQVQGKVFDKVVGVVSERLPIESMQESVTGTIRGSAASVSLATFAVLLRLTTEGTLIAARVVSL